MKIDSSDIEVLKKFFKDNEYMTNMELARVAGVHAATIRSWRRKCGVKQVLKVNMSFARPHRTGAKDRPSITDQKIWDNKEWFEDFYYKKKFGILAISKIIGRTVDLVYGRFRKYGIKARTHKESMKNSNPFCNENWLNEQYNIKRLCASKIAKIAGVNEYTIYNWMTKFGLEVRDIYESSINRGKDADTSTNKKTDISTK